MLLIIQIALIVWAWRRGWKAWGLAPLGVSFVFSFFVGLILGHDGMERNMEAMQVVIGTVEIMMIVALAIMIARPPKKNDVYNY